MMISKLKVDQLCQELKARSLGIHGLKNELKERLEKSMVNKTPMANKASEEEAPQHVFSNRVLWKKIAPLEEPIKYPTVGTKFHQPTSDDITVSEKRNYSQTFDRAPFVGVSKIDKIDRFKKRKIDRATGKFIKETAKIENGGHTSEFLRENNIDHTSLPHKWFKAFLPQHSASVPWCSCMRFRQ